MSSCNSSRFDISQCHCHIIRFISVRRYSWSENSLIITFANPLLSQDKIVRFFADFTWMKLLVNVLSNVF